MEWPWILFGIVITIVSGFVTWMCVSSMDDDVSLKDACKGIMTRWRQL